MDERFLFDRFHEALDKEPRPGAYEQLRLAMTNRPIARQRRPAFRVRWTKLGFRIAAAVTAVVIAIGLLAAFLVAHQKPVGTVPSTDENVKAYQAMMATDYHAMDASTSGGVFRGPLGEQSGACQTIGDTSCEAAIEPVVASLQHWIADLNAFNAPARYAVLDGQLRRHLSEGIAELNSAVAFQKANNRQGFALAMGAAFYERAWIDPTTFAIQGSYARVASSYRDAIHLASQSLYACDQGTPGPADLGCSRLFTYESCAGDNAQTCETDVQAAETQIQNFLIALLQNAAPSSMTMRDAALQAELANADTSLLAITDGLLTGETAKVDAAEGRFTVAVHAAATEISSVTNT